MSIGSLPTAELIYQGLLEEFPLRSYVRRVNWRRWSHVIGVWMERSRQRRALADLDNRLLDDVAITRSEAACEIAKPFWR